MPRVCAAPPRCRRAPTRRRRDPRGVDVEPQGRDLDRLVVRARRPRAGHVAGVAAGAEGRAPARPAASATARWCRCRGGRERSSTEGGSAGAFDQLVELGGVISGQSPGTSSTRSAPSSSARCDAVRRRLVMAAVLILEHHRAVAARRSAARRGRWSRPGLGRRRGAPQRDEDVGEHGLYQGSTRASGRALGADAVWRASKFLIGRMARVVTAQDETLDADGRCLGSAEARTRASARRGGGGRRLAHQHVGFQHRQRRRSARRRPARRGVRRSRRRCRRWRAAGRPTP